MSQNSSMQSSTMTRSKTNVRTDGRDKKGSNKSRNRNEIVKCKDCNKELSESSQAMTCDICHRWLCIQCLEVPEELYASLQKYPVPHAMFPCKDCTSTASSWREMNPTLVNLKDSQDQSLLKFDKFEKEWSSFKNELRNDLKEAVKVEIEKSLKETVEPRLKQLEEKLTQDLVELQSKVNPKEASNEEVLGSLIKDTVREELQKERKKVNLILYNVRESSENNTDARVRHDINMVKRVNSASAEVKDIDKQIVSIHRLGKNNPDKARPLRVVFSKAKTKFDLLTNSFKLSTSENDEMRKVKLAIDRTQSEMNEHKRLIEEIERRKSHGESNLIIRKGRIVSKSDVQGNRPAAAGSINETGRIDRGNPRALHLIQEGGAIGGFGLLEEEEVSDRMSEIRSVVSSENLEMDGAFETEVNKFPTLIRSNEFASDDGGLGLAVGGFSASPRGNDQSI